MSPRLEKVDPYNRKESYEKWKEEGARFEGISNHNQKLIQEFIFDLEQGLNVNDSSKKGSRSYARLLTYRTKLKLWAVLFSDKYNKNIDSVNRKQFHEVCKELREGIIKKANGEAYTSPEDYIKAFKTFWHWLQKIKNGKIEDITNLMDTKSGKPVWVYLSEKDYRRYADSCHYYYRVLCLFLLDTGMRVTEMKNIRVSSFSEDFSTVEIKDEHSKTFGRKIKLMLTKDLIKDFIETNKLKEDDLLFDKNVAVINQYLKNKAIKMFGDKKSKAGELCKNFTLGDCRHNSACYWLPKYPNPQGMMYRFGWKKTDKIFYYSEFLGMADNISETNMLSETDKTQMQKDFERISQEYKDLRKENIDIKKAVNMMMERESKIDVSRDIAAQIIFNTDDEEQKQALINKYKKIGFEENDI